MCGVKQNLIMNIIKIENIQHKYGSGKKEIRALNGIDLEIKQGETIAFIGPDCRNVIWDPAVLRYHPICK